MQRSLLLILFCLSAAVLSGLWWLLGAAPPPAPLDGAGGVDASATAPERLPAKADVVADPGAVVREAASTVGDPLLDDPDIRAGLCGFRGRVVDHTKAPVPDTGVRIYRGAMDTMLTLEADLFGDAPAFAPKLVAGETQTRADGRFEITGVWPRGVYLMFAGIGSDAPTHQVLTKAPSPGEVVDLGDVVLNDAGVITGVVYDEDGEPMVDALVRAADIPGALATFFPAERFDPEGALLIREREAPVQVLPMPPWVKQVFDELPIPTTRTAADGSFRLVGVMPGSNMFAVTTKRYLSHVKDSVMVRAGQTKDVGRVGMRLGEELYARVLDEKGKPIEGAEVAAGSTLTMVPIDLAQLLGETNADGEIDGTGFSPGKVTVAARRSKKHAWVIAEPQSINNDVLVTLPATFGVDVTVELSDGRAAEEVRFKLLRGKQGDGAAEMFMLGFAPPVELDGRMSRADEGRWHIEDLNAGTYTLLAEVAGQASGSAVFSLEETDANAVIKLRAPDRFSVRVVDQEQAPIKNVAIFAQARGERVVEMPLNCGRTDEEGRVEIDKIRATSLRVSADHPRWGVVHGEAEQGEELVLMMLEPGSLRGMLVEGGKPPLPGKFTVALMRRRGGGPRGPLESVPQMITAGLDGAFEVNNLQPGAYWVGAVNSLDTLRSPGSTFGFAQSMFIDSDVPDERFEVASGQVAEVRLEVGEAPLEGPTAQLTGSVMVNGRAAAGYTVLARIRGTRFAGEVDERGRFDLGVVSAGEGTVSVLGGEAGMFMGPGQAIWSKRVELAEGEPKDLAVDVYTSTIQGFVYLPDGSPARKVFVRAEAKLGESSGRARKFGSTNDDGSFRFDGCVEGVWRVTAEAGEDDERSEGQLRGLELKSGQPLSGLRLQLQAQLTVSGTVDLSVLEERGRWRYLTFERSDAPEGDRSSRGVGVGDDGRFVSADLLEGRYEVKLTVSIGGGSRGDRRRVTYTCGVLDVGAQGLKDVKLVPRAQ
jgi:hypothetical protein